MKKALPGSAGLFELQGVNDVAVLAGLAEHDDEDDLAHQGDQVDEHPAPVLAGVVETADGDGQAGDQHGEGVQGADIGDVAQDGADDEIRQGCPPVAGDVGATAEIGEAAPHIHIVIDDVCHNEDLSFFEMISV